MPNHRKVPDWKYGDILTNDEPSHPNVDHTSRAMFVAWDHLGDWDPNESVPILIDLHSTTSRVIKPYCGWWTDVEA